MDLPNKYFEDFPIEYKKIRRDDFSVRKETFTIVKNQNGFSFVKKVHNENRSRYLNEDLQGLINLEEKDTMVIRHLLEMENLTQ
ncbi:MAG: hypothetical protein KBA33_00530 [Cloacibacterium sp.]|nr:hypothetical protein [Cloacibacterium sp.]